MDVSMQNLLKYHKAGTEYIRTALSIDENCGNLTHRRQEPTHTCRWLLNLISRLLWTEKKDEAVNYYKLGIEEFLLGLSIKVEGAEAERGLRIQDKMESNLKMALERVEVLSK